MTNHHQHIDCTSLWSQGCLKNQFVVTRASLLLRYTEPYEGGVDCLVETERIRGLPKLHNQMQFKVDKMMFK
jgi:hypothetical protein